MLEPGAVEFFKEAVSIVWDEGQCDVCDGRSTLMLNWILTEVFAVLAARNTTIDNAGINSKQLSELVRILHALPNDVVLPIS